MVRGDIIDIICTCKFGVRRLAAVERLYHKLSSCRLRVSEIPTLILFCIPLAVCSAGRWFGAKCLTLYSRCLNATLATLRSLSPTLSSMDDLSSFITSRMPTKSSKYTRKLAKDRKTSTRNKKSQKTRTPSNLSEKKPSDDDQHKSSSTAKEKPKATAKSKVAKIPEVDAEDVPAPAPDTGLSATKPVAIHTGVLPVIPSQTPTGGSPHSYGSGFSALPPMTAWLTSTALSVIVTPTGTGPPNGTSRALGLSDNANGKGSKHSSVVLIVLVTIGVAFLLLGGLIFFWRVRSRPRKRCCPTPSLPIFQDPFADQDLKGDEESLFGGKERSSAVARPNSNGLYHWVQYTPKTSEASLATKGAGSDVLPLEPTSVYVSEKKPRVTPPVPPPINSAPANLPIQMQNALTRAANRVSTLSMSIYPTSPQSTHTYTGIGLAISGTSPLTADGTSVLQRKPSKDRMSKYRNRHSLAATEYLDFYDSAPVHSPSPGWSDFVPSPVGPMRSSIRKSTSIHASATAQGRARVKAGYTPGGAPLRASSTVAGITTLKRAGDRTSMIGQSEEDMQYVLPPLSPALKSDERRERDTRALASALGLASPTQQFRNQLARASLTPTIHPDDSITLAGDRMRNRAGTHSRGHSEVMSPGTEASARLGNLMLAEFTSMASLPSTRTVVGGMPASGSKPRVIPRKTVNGNGGPGGGMRADDRPPRVPSPPPLPSLAQMAMSHANPEEYADYRSPTYSIYGLYEAERKSRMPASEGGS